MELLKEEFKAKFQETNPILTNLTLWCLEHEYEGRPDFLDLEFQIEKIEYQLNNKEFISEIIPIGSYKTTKFKPDKGNGFVPKKKQDFFRIVNVEKYGYNYLGRKTIYN